MELLYLWIDDYKSIKKQGFNFSPKYRFDFNSTDNTLSIGAVLYYPDNFFGDNIMNVTAIVGENGSGKSTLIEYLLTAYFTSDNYLYENFLTAWKSDADGGKIIIHYGKHFIDSLNLELSGELEIGIKEKSFDQEEELLKSPIYRLTNPFYFINKVFYSNSVDQRPFYFRGFNLSTDYLLRGGEGFDRYLNQFQIQNTNLFQARLHFILDLKRQIDYVASNPSLPFSLPELIRISPSNLNLSDILNYNFSDEIKRGIGFILQRINLQVPSLSNTVFAELWEAVISYIIKKKVKEEQDFDVVSFLDSISYSDEDFTQTVLNNLVDEEATTNFINEFIDFAANLSYNPPDFNRRGDGYWEVNSDEWNTLFELLEEYPFAVDFLIFSWDLPSTGEIAFLKLFSRIYSIKDQINSPGVPILLLIDEGETGLHPNWQRKLNFYLLNFLTELFPENKVQIILTSHSPFVLSDLPKENVIFLKKDDQGYCNVVDGINNRKLTFCSNIHTLLSDAFFLESLMGEFAKNKVNEINSYLKGNLSLDSQYIEFIIDIIGEPIIQKYLKNKFKEIIHIEQTNSLLSQIKSLEERLKEIK